MILSFIEYYQIKIWKEKYLPFNNYLMYNNEMYNNEMYIKYS
jgi:hypothetical protein